MEPTPPTTTTTEPEAAAAAAIAAVANDADNTAVSEDAARFLEQHDEGARKGLERMLAMAKEKGFSEKEAVGLVEFTKRLCSKSMKEFLVQYVKYLGVKLGYEAVNLDSRTAKKEAKKDEKFGKYRRLCMAVNKIPSFSFTGYQEIKITDSKHELHTLRMQISTGPVDYAPTVQVEAKYIEAVLKQMGKLADMCRQYYYQAVSHFSIMELLAEIDEDTDVSILKINPHTCTLFLDPDAPLRLCVFMYYVDMDGNPVVYDYGDSEEALEKAEDSAAAREQLEKNHKLHVSASNSNRKK